MTTWFKSMFSGEAEQDDVVRSGALNITKITTLLVPIGTAIAAFFEAQVVDDGPLGGLSPGQKLALWIALLTFIGLVVIADIFGRAIATSAALRAHIAPLPKGLKGTWKRTGADVDGTLVAVRVGSLDGGGGGELLLVPDEPGDAAPGATWVPPSDIKLN